MNRIKNLGIPHFHIHPVNPAYILFILSKFWFQVPLSDSVPLWFNR